MRIRVGHLYPDYLNIYADRGNIAVLARRAALRGHELDVTADLGRRRGPSGRARPALRRRRAGSRAGADRPRPRREGPGDPAAVEAARAARGLRRLPAARARLPRPARRLAARRRALPARDGRRRAADDRRRPARVRARAGRAADARRLREPRRPDAARPRRGAARPRRGRLRERRRVGLRGLPRRPRGRHLPPRPAAAAESRGSPTGCSPRRSRTRPAASRRSSSRCPTASRPRRTRSQRGEPATAAAASRIAAALRSTSSLGRPPARDRDPHRRAPCQSGAAEPAGAVLLHAPRPPPRRLVVVAEADEHLVEDDVVQDLDAGLRAEQLREAGAWSQQRSTSAAIPLRPSARIAA